MSRTSAMSKQAKPPKRTFLVWGRTVIISLYRQASKIPPDGRLVIFARTLRTFGYGFTSVLLGVVLINAKVPPVQIGILLTVAALGSITFSFVVGMYADHVGRKRLLVISALLMMGTGCIFAFTRRYPLLLIAAFCGTISPSTNDNTPFSGVEQSILAQTSPPQRHAILFAFYNLAAQLAGALGGLLVGLPEVLAHVGGIHTRIAVRGLFLLYGALAGMTALLFLRLSPRAELEHVKEKPSLGVSRGNRTLCPSSDTIPQRQKIRGVVLQLASLFALDAFAGGLAVQTILAVWFRQRFGVSLGSLGLFFFAVNLLAALSFLAAPRLSERFGLLKTMIGPHFVSNIFLLLVPSMPVFPLAALFLLLRQSLSKIDVPARQAYTMALVSPEERTAAASFTTIARSVAVSASPLLAGAMLNGPLLALGVPFLLAGCLAMSYDVTMWCIFRHVPLHVSKKDTREKREHHSQFQPLHFSKKDTRERREHHSQFQPLHFPRSVVSQSSSQGR